MKRILFLIVAALLLVGSLLAGPRAAQALTASPIRLELNADPGKSLLSEFKLFNEGKTTETYYIGFKNFEAKDESGTPTFTTNNSGLAEWIKTQESVTIGSREWKTIPITISVPQNIEPGGYFAAAFATTVAPKSTEGQNVLLEGQVGTLVLLQVNGNFTQGADVAEFDTTTKRHWFTSLPIEFYYRFQNAGSSWVKPLGDIVVKNWIGSTSKVIPTNPDKGNVLPKSIRRFTGIWQGEDGSSQLPEGFWNKVRYEWRNFAFGRYHIDLNLAYGNNSEQTAHATTIVWVIPWHLLSIVIIGLVVLFSLSISVAAFIIFRFIKKRRK